MSPSTNSSSIALKVAGVSKRYRLGTRERKADTLASAAADLLLAPLRNFRNLRRLNTFAEDEDSSVHWALRDICFEARAGEVIGLIGRNGAGKSTLLKILSRITSATSGRMEIQGRVASLLEVGTGFHPDLTGRDNIFMNGALLGMRRREIERKFDEIVDFSGVERFIDTPVKRYSSGMYVRLAFAVAAHLESEILFVDEVLAVGDLDFQRKCLGKMESVGRDGRTVIFVSHSMPAIRTLCGRCLLFESGRLVMDGPTGDVLARYFSNSSDKEGASGFGSDGVGDDRVRLMEADLFDIEGNRSSEWNMEKGGSLRMRVRVKERSDFPVIFGVHLHTAEGSPVGVCVGKTSEGRTGHVLDAGDHLFEVKIPGGVLNEGTYTLSPSAATYAPHLVTHFFERGALLLQVREDVFSSPDRTSYSGPMPGVLRPRWDWIHHRP